MFITGCIPNLEIVNISNAEWIIKERIILVLNSRLFSSQIVWQGILIMRASVVIHVMGLWVGLYVIKM